MQQVHLRHGDFYYCGQNYVTITASKHFTVQRGVFSADSGWGRPGASAERIGTGAQQAMSGTLLNCGRRARGIPTAAWLRLGAASLV